MELEGLRWTPEAIRLADGERLCVVEADGNKRPCGSDNDGTGYGLIEAAYLTLGSHLAQRCLRFTVFARRWCHQIAAGHIRRHSDRLAGHRGVHRTLSCRAASCQPTQRQHYAQQQNEKRPENFHGSRCGVASLPNFRERVATSRRQGCDSPRDRTDRAIPLANRSLMPCKPCPCAFHSNPRAS